MKKIILLLVVTCFSMITFAQSIGIGTTTPNASSILEIKASNKGLLIPRTSTASRTAIVTPAKGLMVYDTTTNSFWYHNGTAWTQIGTSGGSGWSLTGNSGTDSITNFIGTTDAHPLVFRVNNVRAGFIGYNTSNTSFGYQAFSSNTTGNYNTATGTYSLSANTTGFNNTAFGSYALLTNNTGSFNVAAGSDALHNNTSGSYNVTTGASGMYSNTTGNSNTVAGFASLFNNTAGYSNVAIGINALYNNTVGHNLVAVGDSALFNQILDNNFAGFPYRNTAVGSKALFANTNGQGNTATGFQALYNNITGIENVASGSMALFANQTGHYNVAIGAQALTANTSGQGNIAIGWAALYSNTTTYNSIAIGQQALANNGSGATQSYEGVSNIGIGYQSLFYNQTGYNNTAVGGESMQNNNSGYNNAAFGYGALSNSTNGIGATAIGVAADVNTPGLQNATAIGYFASVDASNKVRIGNTNVTSIGGQVGWTVFSDGRYKKNIKHDVQGLAFIKSLQPITYTVDINSLNEHYAKERKQDAHYATMKAEMKESEDKAASIVYNGFIAQDVEKAAQSIGYNFSGVDKPQTPDGLYGLRYSDFVVPLVKAVQEQQAIIEDQNKKIDLQQQQINTLLNDVEQLKQKINTSVK